MDSIPINVSVEPQPPTILRPARPRVWTVFAVLALSLVGTAILQGIGGAIWAIANGVNLQRIHTEFPALLKTPRGFMFLMGLAQASFAFTLIAATLLSPVPFRSRLGFVRTGFSVGTYLTVVVGSLIPFAIGAAMGQVLLHATAIAPPTDDEQIAEKLYSQMTPGIAILFVLFISLVPAFTEEALFRGYMQRRLLERWSPSVALTIVALLFAAMHGTAQWWAIQVLPLGIWLGILAWRTGSIWPGIWCHLFVNGSRNIWGIVVEFAHIPQRSQMIALVAVGVVALIAFVASVRTLASETMVAQADAV